MNTYSNQSPVRLLNEVMHVGTLDARRKGIQGASLEGNGLSVSIHPAAWVKIARLGGLPWWKAKRKEGVGKFLDIRRIDNNLRHAMVTWGITHAYVTESPVYAVQWYDDEDGFNVEMQFDCKAKAIAELDFHQESGETSAVLIERVGLKASLALEQRIGFTITSALAFDMLATIYAEDVLKLDGVWWSDKLAPNILSAPRGVLNLTSIPNWDFKEM